MDVGGYSRFKYLYFRSEYKASVSEPVRVRHRDWTEMVLGAHTVLYVFPKFECVLNLISIGEILVLCLGVDRNNISEREHGYLTLE